jgi:glutaconate CoA-transferase subunit A
VKSHMSKVDKTISMQESVGLISSGDILALGGVTLYRRPMAFALSLLTSHAEAGNPIDLTLLCFTAGLESDILVGAGMVEKVRSCYFGLEAFGLAPNFTSSANSGTIEIVEETEASLALGIRAAIAGVGFMPSTAWVGTDLPKLRPDVKTVFDPYSGEELIAFPQISCDVAVIHALEADASGNANIGDHWGVDRELALVADKVIITAEKIVPRLEEVDIFGPTVSAVVEIQGGAWPTSCHPLYPLDGIAVLDYTEKAGTDEYADLIQSWCGHHGAKLPAT